MAGTRIMITLPEKVTQELEEIAKEKALSKSMLIRLALDDFFRKEKGESNESK